jgi:hypothetical protein
MEKAQLLERLKEILASEDLLTLNKETHELKSQFAHIIMEEERVFQKAALAANTEDDTDGGLLEEGAEQTESSKQQSMPVDPINEDFDAFYEEFKTKHRALAEAKKATEESNLKLKKELIEKLRLLIQEEENIGAAFATQKEIQEQWKEIGDIPRDARHDVQRDYSQLMEQFYYNISIYKELREHDLKRNETLKLEVIEKLKGLAHVHDIKELESSVKLLQQDWEEIGGTSQEKWEELKSQYWTIIKTLYDRIRNHYETKREAMQKNLEAKQEMVVKAEQLLNEISESTDQKAWEEKTEILLKLQAEWKSIGFGPRKDNEEIWTVFRGLCDQFFEQKHAFYKDRNAESDKIADQKKQLIAEVNKHKESTDWKEATQAIIQLQKDWKNLGNAGQRNEQKLWREFRAACDGFFNRKEAHFAEQDAVNAANLIAKEVLIAEIEAYQVKEDKKETLSDLKALSTKFNALGNVPFKEKDRVYKTFKTAMDKHYEALDLKGAEKEKVMFSARMETMASSPQANKQFDEERRRLRMQIQKAEQEIRQYENNLGFFANSKNNAPFIKEVENKIEASRKIIEDCKNKLKLIPNE